MKRILFLSVLIFQSCIPLKKSPVIKDYIVGKGKRIKKTLPKEYMFLFKNPKEAKHFHNYINRKFNSKDISKYNEITFDINSIKYHFNYFEIEINDKSLNVFAPVIVTAAVLTFGTDVFEKEDDYYFKRKGNWYIAIKVYKDCLDDNSLSRETVLKYLRELKEGYLSTNTYDENIFKD